MLQQDLIDIGSEVVSYFPISSAIIKTPWKIIELTSDSAKMLHPKGDVFVMCYLDDIEIIDDELVIESNKLYGANNA